MHCSSVRHFVFRLVTVTIISMGFAQVSGAGIIGTQAMIDGEARQERLTRIESILLRQDVADQLVAFGVAPEMVLERMQHMTSSELAVLEDRIDEQIAGGDSLGVIGAVFLVLLVLELMGVTDIFKAL